MAEILKAYRETDYPQRRFPRSFTLEMLTFTVSALAALAMIWMLFSPQVSIPAVVIAGVVFTLSIVVVIRLVMDPDSVRAHQSEEVLQVASSMLGLMKDGMNSKAAQGICNLLLPSTSAVAVSITDREKVLGYAGAEAIENPVGGPIRTQATYDVIAEAETHVLYTAEEIGFPDTKTVVNAAIIAPLMVGDSIEGTLKFDYRSGKKITETQKSIAEGFALMLSSQMAAAEYEEQRKLATSMELKMLQSQINPHFLFNTINTIASLIRTDPAKARVLLRDFAVFYRSTLEDSSDRILLERELQQTQRYFSFEVARFGEDRLELKVDQSDDSSSMMVPPFIVQPIAENAVKHAMPSEGKLTVSISARIDGDDVIVVVEDDGVGMSQEACENIMHPESSGGLGIAVKNVHDRMKGFFGPDARMLVESELGKGTRVTLRFPDCAQGASQSQGAEDALEDMMEVERAGHTFTAPSPVSDHAAEDLGGRELNLDDVAAAF